MTAAALIKKVMDAYPEAFEGMPQPKLKLVKQAIVYAGKVAEMDDLLSPEELKARLISLTGIKEMGPKDFLKGYRYRSNLTQVGLAKKTGISQSNIAAMESGKRPIGIGIAKKLAKVLKCDYRRLV